MRRWFGVSFNLPPYSPPFLRVIHPFFLCSESQASLYKTPAVLSGRPRDPAVIAAASRREWRPQLPREGDKGTMLCVSVCHECVLKCVCVFVCSAIRAVYLLVNCLNTCDNIQWSSSTLQYSREEGREARQWGDRWQGKATLADAAQCWAECRVLGGHCRVSLQQSPS